MTESPSITVLTATLNNLESLKRTVASVAAQTFRDFEHIVVDGGSTDGTRDWLETKTLGIRWISEPDDGIAEALNKGIQMAHGQWVLVLHADDTFLSEDSLGQAVRFLDSEGGIVSCDVLFSTALETRTLKSGGCSSKINFKTTIPHQGAFIHMSVFETLGLFDTDFRVELDYDFFLRACRAGVRVEAPGEVLSVMPDTGISSRRDWASLLSRFREEREIHRRHCPGTWWRLVYATYWPTYLSYRFLRQLVSGEDSTAGGVR